MQFRITEEEFTEWTEVGLEDMSRLKMKNKVFRKDKGHKNTGNGK